MFLPGVSAAALLTVAFIAVFYALPYYLRFN